MAMETDLIGDDEQDDTSLESDDTQIETETPGAEDQGESDPASGDDPADMPEELISDEEFNALVQAGDPAALRTALNRSYTQKTQKLAEIRKQFESVSPYMTLLQQDPKRFAELLVQDLGLKLASPEPAAPATDPTAELKTALIGQFGEGIGGQVGDVITKFFQAQSKSLVSPMEQAMQRMQEEAVARESKAVLSAFAVKHPDFKQHEDVMMALAKKYKPADGVADIDYLDDLYDMAVVRAERARNARNGVTRTAKGAKTAATTGPTRPALSGKQTPTPPAAKNLSSAIDRAFEAAKRGVRYQY